MIRAAAGRFLRPRLLALARTRLGGEILREAFVHMSFAIPVQRLRETAALMAFYHPAPLYPVHILLVPKRSYASLLDLPPEDSDFQRDLFVTVRDLVRELGLEEHGYRLIVNGGRNQDVPLLHFHLISEGAG